MFMESTNTEANDLSKLDKELCLNCLGRLFGRMGHGLTNLERGRAIGILRSEGVIPSAENLFFDRMDETGDDGIGTDESGNTDGGTVSSEECYICEGLMDEIPAFADLAVEKMKGYEFDNFQIGVKVDADICRREEQVWAMIDAKDQELIKAELNREIGKLVQLKIEKEVEFSKPQVVAIVDTAYDHVDIQIAPVFIYGRYRKFERGIPQTKWPCRKCRGRGCESCDNTGKQYMETVEEFITDHVLELTGGSGAKFHGMGREDIDARMLGNGRPFVIEITKPRRRSIDLASLETCVNEKSGGKIGISDLNWTIREKVKWIKAARFPKVYSTKITFSRPVGKDELSGAMGELDGVTIEQRTPVRVSHRRSDLVRKREVLEAKLVEFDEESGTSAVVSIKGEAGLYIKELLHSDEGRTEPSLRSLLSSQESVEIEIASLDVLEVCDDGEADIWDGE